MQTTKWGGFEDEPGLDGILALFNIARAAYTLSPQSNIDIGALKLVSALAELGPSRLSDVALEANLDISTVSRHLSSLEKQGLVQRSPDPDDGRASRLELTDDALNLMKEMLRNRVAAIAPALEKWSDKDKSTLFELLIRLSADMREQVEIKRGNAQ